VARALVIVESVAKATRIQSMLGPDFIVKPFERSRVLNLLIKLGSAPQG